ncbi:MAG: hypothetical protein CMG74_13085 [Candidatus Marinimicrobia bacterium]|nr:hypothetical protein [Candidatus Neomarinimicrobiota bacterium]|tara:strand:+ start:43487 stop:44932 length:1446 start_codon:yes stop_codon:yes gene_type:complete
MNKLDLRGKRVTIFIGSEVIGFLVSIGRLMAESHGAIVDYIISSKDKKNVISKIHSGNAGINVLQETVIHNIQKKDIISKALKIEDKYKINLSGLIAEDRGLGQGYFGNADKLPTIKRSLWSKETKLKSIIELFYRYEALLNKTDLLIHQYPDKIRNIIVTHNEGISKCLIQARFGDRYMWSDNNFLTSSYFINSIKKNLNDYNPANSSIDYQVDSGAKILIEKHFNKSYAKASIELLKNIIIKTKQALSGNYPNDSYYLYGWTPTIIRNVRNYNYIKKIGKNPTQLKKYKIVYFPLQIEPEVSLYLFSPEFTNFIEAISWISKSVPADYIIVIKENIHFGTKSKNKYKQLTKMANVCWAHPEISSWEWIESSNLIATITGTVGVEGVYFKKPVISFGAHQIINYLPTVLHVKNFMETRSAIHKLLNQKISDSEYNKSREVLYKSQIDSSFELIDYKNVNKTRDFLPEIAKIAINNFFDPI